MKTKNLKLGQLTRQMDFPIIIQMSYLESNIPSNIYYVSIGSEILRFAKTTSDSNNFITLATQIMKRMQKSGS